MKAKDFIKEFSSAVDWAYVPSEEIYASLNNLLSSLRNSELVPKSRRTDLIFYHANKKFKFNADGVRSFLSFAANHGITFNYHEKNVINRAFDEDNKSLLLEMLNCHKTSSNNDELVDLLMSVYSPIHKNATLQQLHSELRNPTLTRKDSKPKDRSYEILTSLFSAYVYTSFPEKYMHEVNDPIERKHNYYSDYWEHLHSNHPDLFSRDNALCGLHITKDDQIECGGYNQLSSKVLEFVRSTYANLTNHGFMAILIDTIDDRNVSSQWKLFSDIILYSEKHIASEHKQYFFKSKDIEEKILSTKTRHETTAVRAQLSIQVMYFGPELQHRHDLNGTLEQYVTICRASENE